MSTPSVRPRILCISLSPLRRDSRVLRQIGVLVGVGEVTTVGYGQAPDGVSEHIQVPDELPSLPQTVPGVLALALRRFRSVELGAPGVAYARNALAGKTFDLVVANDARVLALAMALAGDAPVWADMHEWAPEERTHVLSWRLLVAPFMVHLCASYLPKAAAVTTVGSEIAALYQRDFGVLPRVMRNAAAFNDLQPSSIASGRIRLVHSGGAVPGRNLELMFDVMTLLDQRFSLDLYLVPAADGGQYLNRLRLRAQGDPRIMIHDPVAPDQLARTLNEYDIGVFWIPPVHTNARLTLPNKIFDYVQARLAVAIGPTVEMARLVQQYQLGVISEEFSVAACAATLSGLDQERIGKFKANADASARELSFDRDRALAIDLVRDLLASHSKEPPGLAHDEDC